MAEPTNLTALRARLVAMLEAEGRETKAPWKRDEHYRNTYIWGPKGEMVADHDANPEFEFDTGGPVRMRGTGAGLPQIENADVIVAARNSFRPLLTLALGLIDGCDQCEWCLGLGEITMLSTKPCWHCAPSRTLLKRLAEELDK